MKRIFSLLFLMLSLGSMGAFAEEATWKFVWDTSRSSGGEGFYNISDHEKFTQVEFLNGLQWTLSSDSYTTGYTGTSGQYLGTAANPITHGTLSTSYLKGKILKVSIEAKTKENAQKAKVGVKVNDVDYGNVVTLDDQKQKYEYVPAGDVQEGDIVITLEQTEDTKGIIYFYSIEIVYDGEGVVRPEVELVSPQLSFATTDITIEAGDGPLSNPITNPFKVAPVTYSSSDESIIVVSASTGKIHSVGPLGTATVTATFEGNDTYLPETASYNVTVVAKPVIAAPEVDVKGGTFTEPVTVTITSNDPNALAIWYSTTLTSVDDMGYDEQTIIVPGKKATVVIDHSCSLLCVAVGNNNIGEPVLYSFEVNIPLKADFTAEESARPYYSMGWDSIEEATTWHYYGINETSTWTLTEGSVCSGTKPFSSIDPSSAYSLSLKYSNSQQRERAVSPEIEVKPNSSVGFYACFAGIWLYYGAWHFYVNDLTAGTQDRLLNSFLWAQNNEFTGPSWEKFTFDLSKYAGHTCTFEFIYEGAGGEDVSIDGFEIKQQDNSAASNVVIMQGESVHFLDLSQGHPEAWEWYISDANSNLDAFAYTSTEQNPVITFDKAGEYTVMLVASKGEEKSISTREKYVVVKVESPKAHIGLPEGVYLSPWAYAYVPLGMPLTFHDASTGQPDTWQWKFEGTDITESREQNPTVTYQQEGRYGLELVVGNAAGDDRDFLVEAIHAGGAEDVWNILPEETTALSEVYMGYYGSYAGSNWLGMEAFAEHFDKPLAPSTIDNVTAYFAAVTADNQNADITVSICAADEDGMPGQPLATSTLKVSELRYDEKEVVPTVFRFAEAVEVDSEFFIVISGFPNSGYNDNVSLLCAYRGGKSKNTAYHYLLDEDENYNLLDTGQWYANIDDPLSLCLTAHLAYASPESGIKNVADDSAHSPSTIYSIDGKRLTNHLRTLPRGIYIQRSGNEVRKALR